MQLTVTQVLVLASGIGKISSLDTAIGTALKIKKNKKLIEEVSNEFNDKRSALFNEHGTPNEKGMFSFEKETAEMINEKIAEYGAETLDIDIQPIKIEELGEDFKLSSDDLERLELILDFGEETSNDDQGDIAA